ncbi:MAG: M20/M25/M40 family metallo-hydrolase [Nitrososphaeraceae archaeon]|nr:M20/M25/M40 family metallo-hydrolase [Nitrososphaeraceae archaeon]MDW0137170.1 M20/M25/M40 family metallo-hydrolase [Nitrososphaeraceae archaeon]MDW0142334.1 M20/M25/M40 family metallo-hydrolase [Nitrososphaeraceae archaeon]MDW0152456.1 M20/M25/M40 family metallo-hydrolase [Nitrososphaeraceae archaeon]MDW0153202.1 M20/M25/M40 family metallo-hydrolase [Nitrososphaeraceae archaeon]
MTIIESRVESEIDTLTSQLQQLIRVPSVSAKKQLTITKCAELVSEIMSKAGIKSELLKLDYNSEEIAPVVYGEVKSKNNPDGKTILFYNHYDVQPPEPIELWDDDPFSGKIDGNLIFGRGASDDKGELITRIKAVQYFLDETGDVPCNVKFIIEGEEEVGSSHLEKYLIKYRQKFSCDATIWEFGYIDENETPIISLGMKGLLCVELHAICANADLHSSLAVLVENPAWRLVHALKTIRDENGTITIKNWHEDIRDFSAEELECIKQEDFDISDFKKNYGLSNIFNENDTEKMKKASVGGVTSNISGLFSGYIGEGSKTVLPSKAMAKLDFRLVPEMKPEKQFELLRDHFDSNGFKDIQLKFLSGEPACRIPVNNEFVKLVEASALEEFGKVIKSISSAGTGPMWYFNNILKCPCVGIGCTYKYSRIHSPNEFVRIDLIKKTTKCIGNIIERFGKS